MNIKNRKLSSNCDLRCKEIRPGYRDYCGGENYASVYSSKNIFITEICLLFT